VSGFVPWHDFYRGMRDVNCQLGAVKTSLAQIQVKLDAQEAARVTHHRAVSRRLLAIVTIVATLGSSTLSLLIERIVAHS